MANNIIYYSNYCKHSQKVFNLLMKAGLEKDLEFICIDKRGRDPNTNQLFILAENGARLLLPPNIHSVPAMLLIKQQYSVLYGDDILKYYEPKIVNDKMTATNFNGEPVAYSFGNKTEAFGNSIDASYSDKLSIITPPEEGMNNKIKMGDNTAVTNYEQQRAQMEKQMGIGQTPANPFTMKQ
jgi:hypothetical protein